MITKETLPQIISVTLILENEDEYEISAKDVVDIHFDDIKRTLVTYFSDYDEDDDDENDDYIYEKIVDSGYIVVSQNAFKQLSKVFGEEFSSRMLQDTACDITGIEVRYTDGAKESFNVEYDPVEDGIYDAVVEYSNSPSVEINAEGDALISFGKRSHTFHRVDNDYFKDIAGLSSFLRTKIKAELMLSIESIDNFELCSFANKELLINTRIANKELRNKLLPLKFTEVEDISFVFNFKGRRCYVFSISPLKDGRYFVRLGCDCSFFCKSIAVAHV